MKTTSDLLRTVSAIRHSAQALLLHASQLEKDLLEAVREVSTPSIDSSEDPVKEDVNTCPVKCDEKYRIRTIAMGHPNRTQCRMCSKEYET